MSKRKKTRQQKVIADLRRQIQIQSPKNTPQEIIETTRKTSFRKQDANMKTSVVPNSYMYVYKDLFKTTKVTGAVIGVELLLFFLLKNHILKLPFVQF